MIHLGLVDDSPITRRLVKLCFAKESIKVHCFTDGKEAWKAIRATPPDLLLVDTSIAGLDGYSLCKRVKITPETAGIPIILLVDTLEVFDPVRGREAGCEGHLTRPFETTRLVEMVEELLEQKKQIKDDATTPGSQNPLPELLLKLSPDQCRAPFQRLQRLSRKSITSTLLQLDNVTVNDLSERIVKRLTATLKKPPRRPKNSRRREIQRFPRDTSRAGATE